ncbi:MAG: hypothetical protein M1414_05395 [Candidatus Thermoplasmatota archaeon]|nr:hypothetical protein [Candidatus Thermoplasmatota archaeon]
MPRRLLSHPPGNMMDPWLNADMDKSPLIGKGSGYCHSYSMLAISK